MRLSLLFRLSILTVSLWACIVMAETSEVSAKNVLGGALESCCSNPKTGYYRDGYCVTGPEDRGVHVVCAVMTAEFLNFTRGRGNDLITPAPQFRFPGLVPGDRWCLCASRWKEAYDAGVAPPVVLRATNEAAIKITTLEALLANGVDRQ